MSDGLVWFLNTAEGPQGPYSAEQIRAWLKAEQITSEWYVWREGLDSWKSVAEVPELIAAPPAPPAPAAPAPRPAPPPPPEAAAARPLGASRAESSASPSTAADAEAPVLFEPPPGAKASGLKRLFGNRIVRVTAALLAIVGAALGGTKVFAPEIFDAMLGIAPPPPPVVAPPPIAAPPPDPPLDESMLPGELKTENVVILVIDGPRHSEMWGDTERRYIPNLSANLAPLGVIFTDFRNNGVTKTTPGHVAISTGHYQEIENDGSEIPKRPGIATVWLDEFGEPETLAWIIATKDKLAVLAECLDPLWREKPRPAVWAGRGGAGMDSAALAGREGGDPTSGYGLDTETWREAQAILARDHPRFVLINLKEPDVSGHDRNWDGYLAGLRSSDSIAWALWRFLESDSHYAGRTAYFVTSDHGRHLDGIDDGFASHGDDCEGCRRMMLFAAGPDFARGVIVETAREQIDLAVTAARLLGVRLPGSAGKIIPELFPAAAPEAPAVDPSSDTSMQ
jgi:hypothetical protein